MEYHVTSSGVTYLYAPSPCAVTRFSTPHVIKLDHHLCYRQTTLTRKKAVRWLPSSRRTSRILQRRCQTTPTLENRLKPTMGGGEYYFVASVSHFTTDHASLSGLSMQFLLPVATPQIFWCSSRGFFRIMQTNGFSYPTPVLFRRLRTPSIL